MSIIDASARMVAARPRSLSFAEAASVPVVAVTAYQMLFEYAQMKTGQAVLIHGAAGNVGAYAVQLAKQARLQVFATAGPADLDHVRGLGAEMVVNYKTTKFEMPYLPSMRCSTRSAGKRSNVHSVF